MEEKQIEIKVSSWCGEVSKYAVAIGEFFAESRRRVAKMRKAYENRDVVYDEYVVTEKVWIALRRLKEAMLRNDRLHDWVWSDTMYEVVKLMRDVVEEAHKKLVKVACEEMGLSKKGYEKNAHMIEVVGCGMDEITLDAREHWFTLNYVCEALENQVWSQM